jgi:hypothetical protein
MTESSYWRFSSLKVGHWTLSWIVFSLINPCRCFLSTSSAPMRKLNEHSICSNEYYTALSERRENAHEDEKGSSGVRRIRNLQLFDTDVLPRREGDFGHSSSRDYALQDWGIEKHENPTPIFPDSIQAVADEAFRAIVGTWDKSSCLDPNEASNAMARNTVFDYRPVRQSYDRGRIGIEISGANLLRNDLHYGLDHAPQGVSAGGALRHLILVLAGKISQYSSEMIGNRDDSTSGDESSFPPVAVYFNTVKQALAATMQLQILQHQSKSFYGKITIHCLGQDDDIPPTMKVVSAPPGKKTGRARRRNPAGKGLDTTRGVVIVVKPTDFNEEYRPPGPAVGVLPSFQKLVARASAHEVPVVMVSPRFLVDTASGSGWAQTNGGQLASTYGGLEPPRGPMPWILRDFNPPVYCWIGNAVSWDRSTSRQEYPSHQNEKQDYSYVALTQSVMNEGHPWHIFAARRTDAERRQGKPFKYEYEYLASTKSSQGRPTRDIMRRILSEFGS